jgi:hypothetical protein
VSMLADRPVNAHQMRFSQHPFNVDSPVPE